MTETSLESADFQNKAHEFIRGGTTVERQDSSQARNDSKGVVCCLGSENKLPQEIFQKEVSSEYKFFKLLKKIKYYP